MSRIHHYEGEEIIVEFDLSRCIHAGDCTRDLPDVFSTKRSGRWVKPDAAPAADVARVCAQCPTGALRCVRKATNQPMDMPPDRNTVQVVTDGPLYVHANMTVNGDPERGYRAAFCRCGASRLMPYCDNSHRESGFRDAGRVAVRVPSKQTDGSGKLAINSIADGPLMVQGTFTLLDASGHEVCVNSGVAMCRCGASNMKPYCDGSHTSSGFQSDK
ncbi:MAG: CDGSH iron-sulfur domain-containing protein [Mariprofundus sp.]|nr:CDGSH iron-sulfur domain-containing protein [Mariprofundus sp.]